MSHAPAHDGRVVWATAIAAVRPEDLVARSWAAAATPGGPLDLGGGEQAGVERIVVVGGGKAAAGLAAGVEAALGSAGLTRHAVTGLVSVPEGCGRSLAAIEVRETRPAGSNLPTPAVVAATHEMLALVRTLGPRDLVIATITGGGSACLAAPRKGVALEEKIALTRRLAAGGADIATLNAARSSLSLVKGGGLARACRAGRLVALVLSDVIGNDLGVIASGPCLPPADGGASAGPPAAGEWTTPAGCQVRHLLVGDNATAVDAAAAAAAVLGFTVTVRHAQPENRHDTAEEVGRRLAHTGRALLAAARRDGRPHALVEGGEATVRLPPAAGSGGRNQQTVLAAIASLTADGTAWPTGLTLASVGTDGEDGPTTAAGACADAAVCGVIRDRRLDVASALARCDAHPLLETAGGLVVTGPTGTNVADVRLVLARP
jgi:glycerate 2-kinase